MIVFSKKIRCIFQEKNLDSNLGLYLQHVLVNA